MFKIQCSYLLKRIIIVCLVFLIAISVEIAPDFPILFGLAVFSDLSCVKRLWKSMLKDEDKIKKRKHFRFSQNSEREVSRKKAA
ncbi:MAG: hypothetical protein ACQGTM_06180 [bacterium]